MIRTERLTPHMQRVVLGGDGLADFTAGTSTDHYVKLLFAAEGVTYPEPFDMTADPRGVPARAVARDAYVHGARLGPGTA